MINQRFFSPEVVTLVDELAAKEVLAQIHHELTGVAPFWAS